MSRMVSFAVLIGSLVLITILFYRVMASFLVPLFMAALLGVIFQPLHRWALAKFGGRKYVAASITTALVLLSVLAPGALVTTMATLQGIGLAERLQGTDVRAQLTKLRAQFDLEIPNERDLRLMEAGLRHWRDKQRVGEPLEIDPDAVSVLLERLTRLESANAEERGTVRADARNLREALVALEQSQPHTLAQDEALQRSYSEFRIFKRTYLGGSVQGWLKEAANPTDEQIDKLVATTTSTAGSPLLALGGDTLAVIAKLLLGIVITLAALFFLFAEGAAMLDAAVRLSPLEERYVRELVAEFERVCRAVVTATLLSAVVQGVLAGIGFYLFAGLAESVALLMLLTMVLAMVPFTGTALVWVPVCLYMYFVQGEVWWTVVLAIYGAVVISGLDNLIKPIVLHGQSNLHPLLALLSVLGGIQALGPIGIIIGPMVVVFLQTLLKLVQRELLSIDRTAAAAAASASVPASAGAGPADLSSGPGPSSPEPKGGNGHPGSGPPPKKADERGKKRRR